MIDLRHIRTFLTVATELSFRKAAEKLAIAQPALSRTIRDLEERMEVVLLERTTRQVRLTEAGKVFLKSGQKLIEDMEHAVAQAKHAQHGWAGELLVGYNDFAINGLLPRIVRRFRKDFPEVTLKLTMIPSPEMVWRVESGEMDAAFHMGPAGTKSTQSIIVREERLVAVLPSGHRLSKRTSISVSDLADESFVMGRHDTWTVFHQLLLNFCRSSGFQMKIIQEAQHSDGIIGLVAAEMGVALYVDSDWLHTTEGVAVVPLLEPTPSIQSLLTWSQRRIHQNPALFNLVSVTREIVARDGMTRAGLQKYVS